MPLQKKFGKPVSAPSPIAMRGIFKPLNKPYAPPAREHPDPSELVEEYRLGAINAKKAGADGVEFHGANGKLNSREKIFCFFRSCFFEYDFSLLIFN